MARVFVAEDRTLNRKVVVKVLPPDTAGAVHIGRFKQEIALAARLQHPHIVPLLAAGESDGLPFYTMPFVDGETLRERLTRTGELPVAEATTLLRDVARALTHAHAHLVVHRDIKPENILISGDAAVVTDFGVAKALSVSVDDGDSSPAGLTSRGVALGTPAYMSPEQASADPTIDHRADIYAWGVVAYECLAGAPPFAGRGSQAVLAAHISEMPESIGRRRPTLPAYLTDLVMCCLEKRPADRPQSAEDLLRGLQPAAARSLATASATVARAEPKTVPTGVSAKWLPWAVAGAFAASTIFLAARGEDRADVRAPLLTAALVPQAGLEIVFRSGISLSPDGDRLAFVGRDSSGVTSLWLRRLDSAQDVRVANTVDAVFPFWSPDGRSLGFVADGELRIIGVDGGRARKLCALTAAQGQGSWNRGDTILFSGGGTTITRTTAAGGECISTTSLAAGETRHYAPSFVADGRHFLFWESATTSVYVADLVTGRHRLLRKDAQNPQFVAPHWLVFREGRGAALLAQRLDMSSFDTVGKPIRILEGVMRPGGYGVFTVSENGILIAKQGLGGEGRVMFVDRSGRVDSLGRAGEGATWTHSLSRNGRRLASGGWGLWVRDLGRSVATPVASGSVPTRRATVWPAWSPGDSLLAYAVGGVGNSLDLYRFRDGTTERLFDSGQRPVGASDFTPDGRGIAFVRVAGDSAAISELWLYSLADRTSRVVFAARDLATPRISPDGQWVAYVSDEPGLRQVYVRSLVRPNPPERVSSNGGSQPYWRRDGQGLFYVTPNDQIVEVGFTGGATIELGTPRRVLPEPVTGAGLWSVSPDGQRFLRIDPQESSSLTLVNDWRLKVSDRSRNPN